MRTVSLSVLAICLSASATADRLSNTKLEEALGFFVNSCWAGEFSDGKSTDVQCFRPMYGGLFVRSNHVVEGARGPYGGETVFSWNKEEQAVEYTYWDTSGGISNGVMLPAEDGLRAPDETYTAPDGSQLVVSSRWLIENENEWRQVVERVSAEGRHPLWTIRYRRVPLEDGPRPE